MTAFIRIMSETLTADSAGFKTRTDTELAAVRACHEGRHGSTRWVNLAAFSSATDMFRIRTIPGVEVSPDHYILCDDRRYKILSVENVKGRGMYLEILAERCESVVG